jgi:hypothetical protein
VKGQELSLKQEGDAVTKQAGGGVFTGGGGEEARGVALAIASQEIADALPGFAPLGDIGAMSNSIQWPSGESSAPGGARKSRFPVAEASSRSKRWMRRYSRQTAAWIAGSGAERSRARSTQRRAERGRRSRRSISAMPSATQSASGERVRCVVVHRSSSVRRA